jgi:hypothetical protein
MSPAPRIRQGAGATSVALALLVAHVPSTPAQPEQSPPPAACGTLTIPEPQTQLARELLRISAGVLAWSDPDAAEEWQSVVRSLSDPVKGAAWRISHSDAGAFQLSPLPDAEAPPSVAFDLALDLNALRRSSSQPFSRSVRGRSLDALGVDNARRARLAAVPGAEDAVDTLTLVLFSESRAGPPGRWQAVPFGRVRTAPTTGGASGAAPIEVDFGQEWGGVLVTVTDLVLAGSTSPDKISTDERLLAWGTDRIDALRGFASAMEGRMWLWRGAGEAEWCCALPLRAGATDRAVAGRLRLLLGTRLEWSRDDSGRSLATLDLTPPNRAPADAGPKLLLRFISIADRAFLAAAPTAESLDAAPEVLAKLGR